MHVETAMSVISALQFQQPGVTVLMVRMNDGAEILVRRNGAAPVSALAWNANGTMLAFAAEDGDAGLLEL